MAPAPRRTLYARFLGLLLPLLASTFVLASTGIAWFNYQHQIKEADIQRNQALEAFAHVLIKPLWNCDSITTRGIIEAITLQNNVLWAGVPDQCTQKHIQSGEPGLRQAADVLAIALTYQDENNSQHPLGELSIAFQPISVSTAVAQGLVPQLVIFLSVLAAVLASVIWTIQRTIGHPLTQLRLSMRRHQTLEPIPVRWTEEITEVTHTYNTQVRELRYQARHDALTGLGNRLLLEEHLQVAIEQARLTGMDGHVLLLDLNRFKSINDTYGHAAGDAVLHEVAQRLRTCVEPADVLVRLGGDEFVIVALRSAYPSMDGSTTIGPLAARIQRHIPQPIPWKGHRLQIGVSIGWAQFGTDGQTSQELLAHADATMYDEKQGQCQMAGSPSP